MNKPNILLISGWLAVPYKEYQKLYIDTSFVNSDITESDFYIDAKVLADSRNDSNDTAINFKKKMIKKKYYVPLIDFIQLYYDIHEEYFKKF